VREERLWKRNERRSEVGGGGEKEKEGERGREGAGGVGGWWGREGKIKIITFLERVEEESRGGGTGGRRGDRRVFFDISFCLSQPLQFFFLPMEWEGKKKGGEREGKKGKREKEEWRRKKERRKEGRKEGKEGIANIIMIIMCERGYLSRWLGNGATSLFKIPSISSGVFLLNLVADWMGGGGGGVRQEYSAQNIQSVGICSIQCSVSRNIQHKIFSQ
jgi:hypothetical protein